MVTRLTRSGAAWIEGSDFKAHGSTIFPSLFSSQSMIMALDDAVFSISCLRLTYRRCILFVSSATGVKACPKELGRCTGHGDAS